MAPISEASFLEYAGEIRGEVERALEGYVEFDDDCPARLRAAVRHSLLAPGKRLRPLLVLMATEACGCERQRGMPAAVAVEMVHTYSLIHDDLPAMDDDELRRGLPTCHAAYGEALAILAGDALLARAFEILARDIAPPPVAARCCAELAHAAGASALVGGQADDLAAEFAAGDLAMLERIHRRKTGALIGVSLRLGGLVAAAPPDAIDRLAVYGDRLGLAFQIVDDLLDVHGDEHQVGKKTGKDQQRGKLTFPSILGVAESQARVRQLIDEACAAVAALGSPEGLSALARYVAERDR